MATAVTSLLHTTDIPPSTPGACAHCGASYPQAPGRPTQAAQSRIEELESQVRFLTEKATTAVDKLADYEDELRRLKSGHAARPSIAGLHTVSDTNLISSTNQAAASPERAPSGVTPRPAALSRFSSILSRKASPSPAQSPQPAGTGASANGNGNGAPPPPRPPSVREAELEEALERELQARQQAETKVTQMSGELEELSAQLFQQANEMVASERKARARLEERVEVLEGRDAEKRKRLERLERAVGRIERVHGLLKG